MKQLNMNLPCPCCGRPFPPKLAMTGVYARRILTIVQERPDGIEPGDIFDMLYAADPNGGPSSGNKAIHALVWRVNQTLRPQDYEIVSTHKGHGARYVLRPYDADAKRKRSGADDPQRLEGFESASA